MPKILPTPRLLTSKYTFIGVDYVNYRYIIKIARWDSIDNVIAVEPVFTMFILVLKGIFNNNPEQVIFMLKTIYILIMFMSVYIVLNDINIGYAMTAFMLLLYFPSYYLISMALSVSICIFAVVVLIKKEKYFEMI